MTVPVQSAGQVAIQGTLASGVVNAFPVRMAALLLKRRKRPANSERAFCLKRHVSAVEPGDEARSPSAPAACRQTGALPWNRGRPSVSDLRMMVSQGSVLAACAFAIATMTSSPGLAAGVDLDRCRPNEQRCDDIPDSYALVPGDRGRRWVSQAASLILAEEARQQAAFRKAPVVVVSDFNFPLPRRHRRVPDKATGEKILKKCGREILLLHVAASDPRRSERNEVIVDVSVSSSGATCDREERKVFQHGIAFYRVFFGQDRPVALVRSVLAL